MRGAAPEVLVLLPVYNGARFLRQQLDSIIAQEACAPRILLRDDGSRDGSQAILREYAARYPAACSLLEEPRGNLGARGAFALLMQHAVSLLQASRESVRVALADQDDVWHPERLARGLACLERAEAEHPREPLLVHSDLRLIDACGREIAPSMMQYQGLNPAGVEFVSQLLVNTVTGCTVLMNAALLRRALPIPEQAMMHDWWLSLVASRFGRILYIDEPLVDYRQHANNTLGARRHVRPGFNRATLGKLMRLRRDQTQQALIRARAAQAEAFGERFAAELASRDREMIRRVCQMPDKGLWGQRLLQRRLMRSGGTCQG